MKIICLIENEIAKEAVKKGLICEHGLCLYIEYHGKKYLLDSGSTDAFVENANRMKVDLSAVDEAVLSHAHYDHSGGYEAFFAKNSRAQLLVQECLMHKMCFKKIEEQAHTSIMHQRNRQQISEIYQELPVKYIGIPENLRKENCNRMIQINGTCQLEAGVWLVTGHNTEEEVQRIKKRSAETKMYCSCDTGYIEDDFSHEQSLVFEQDGSGLVVCSSCSHSGIDLIVKHTMRELNKPVHTVVGGFHLKGANGMDSLNMTETEVQKMAKRLLELGVQKVYTGHCTGKAGYVALKKTLGDRLHHLSTGTMIEL